MLLSCTELSLIFGHSADFNSTSTQKTINTLKWKKKNLHTFPKMLVFLSLHGTFLYGSSVWNSHIIIPLTLTTEDFPRNKSDLVFQFGHEQALPDRLPPVLQSYHISLIYSSKGSVKLTSVFCLESKKANCSSHIPPWLNWNQWKSDKAVKKTKKNTKHRCR